MSKLRPPTRSNLPHKPDRERNIIEDYRNQAERPVSRTQNLCPECNGTGKTSIYSGGKNYAGDCEKCNGLGYR